MTMTEVVTCPLCRLCGGSGIDRGHACPRCRMSGYIKPHTGREDCPACNQQGLFDAPADPVVRTSDRETSRAAAKSVEVNARESEVVEALRLLVVASSTFDIQQTLARYNLNRDRNCISRRLTSLTRKGIVSDQGIKPGPFGRSVTAYRLVGP